MGEVWEARDEVLGRPVAVKVISMLAGGGSAADEARARLLREARITAALQHPHIVTVHDVGTAVTPEGSGDRPEQRPGGRGPDARLPGPSGEAAGHPALRVV
ncbi:hypothetical protein ABZY90_11950 [Streptomyces sp. NPDC006422]|uniref:hypothetical protein n=1 Tax=unclassified Streptomyces TaxID=2593676 RepID=UPI0033ABB0E7